jgi:SH3-like domain-containing protein
MFALEAGAKVTVLDEQNGWLKIRDRDGRVGWAYSTYVGG